MKYVAIATYASGESTGAVITADSHEAAWERVLELFDGGKNLRGIQMACVLTQERGGGRDEVKVIINSGIVTGVLSDGSPNVEIVDINPDYEDYDSLKEYEESLYKCPDLKERDFTVAHFDMEEEEK